MPNFSGNWKIIRSENFEELLKALGVNMMLRKIAVAAASKPTVEIKQEGESFYIKTSTTVRTTEINFKIGEEFEEQTVDGRPCKSLVKWESENKMVCEQRLLKGEGPKTSWTRELTNDGELILRQIEAKSFSETVPRPSFSAQTRILRDQRELWKLAEWPVRPSTPSWGKNKSHSSAELGRPLPSPALHIRSPSVGQTSDMEGCVGEESFQLWELNRRLEAYLTRVKTLEEQNQLLSAELGGLRAQSGDASWRARADDELAALRVLVDQRWREKHEAEVQRDNLAEELEGVAGRCQQVRLARERTSEEAACSRRALEAEKSAQGWLSSRVAELEREVEAVRAAHEEERAHLNAQAACAPRRLPVPPRGPPARVPEVEELARRLGEAWRGAVRGYQERVAHMESSLGQARERLGRAVRGAREGRLELQQLQAERDGLLERREALEQRLEGRWQDRLQATEKFQLAVDALEQEKQGLQSQIAQILEGGQQLAHLKMSLSLEVATYRTLLEAENSRLQTPGRGSQASLGFQGKRRSQLLLEVPPFTLKIPFLSSTNQSKSLLCGSNHTDVPSLASGGQRKWLVYSGQGEGCSVVRSGHTYSVSYSALPDPKLKLHFLGTPEDQHLGSVLPVLSPTPLPSPLPDTLETPVTPFLKTQEFLQAQTPTLASTPIPPMTEAPFPTKAEVRAQDVPLSLLQTQGGRHQAPEPLWSEATAPVSTGVLEQLEEAGGKQPGHFPKDATTSAPSLNLHLPVLEAKDVDSSESRVSTIFQEDEGQIWELAEKEAAIEVKVESSLAQETQEDGLDAEEIQDSQGPLQKETLETLVEEPLMSLKIQSHETPGKENCNSLRSVDENQGILKSPEEEKQTLLKSLEEKDVEVEKTLEKGVPELSKPLGKEDPRMEGQELISPEGTLETLPFIGKENEEVMRSSEEKNLESLTAFKKESQPPLGCPEEEVQRVERLIEKEGQESLRSLEEEDQETYRPLEKENGEPLKSVEEELQLVERLIEKEGQESLGSLEEEDQETYRSLEKEEDQLVERLIEKEGQESLRFLEEEEQETYRPLEKEEDQETYRPLEKENGEPLKSVEEEVQLVERLIEKEGQESLRSLEEEDQETYRPLEKENGEPLKSVEEELQLVERLIEKEGQESLGSLEEEDQETYRPLEKEDQKVERLIEKEDQESLSCLEEEEQETYRPLEKEDDQKFERLIEKGDQESLTCLEEEDQRIVKLLERENQESLRSLDENQDTIMPLESKTQKPLKSLEVEEEQRIVKPLEKVSQGSIGSLEKENVELLGSLEDNDQMTESLLKKGTQESLGSHEDTNQETQDPQRFLEEEGQGIVKQLEKENQSFLGSLEEEQVVKRSLERENHEPLSSVEKKDQMTKSLLEKESQDSGKSLEEDQEAFRSLGKEDPESLQSLEEQDQEIQRYLQQETQQILGTLGSAQMASKLPENVGPELLKSLGNDQEIVRSLEEQNQESLVSLKETSVETVKSSEIENTEPLKNAEEDLEIINSIEAQESLWSTEVTRETTKPLEKEIQESLGFVDGNQEMLRPLDRENQELRSLGKWHLETVDSSEGMEEGRQRLEVEAVLETEEHQELLGSLEEGEQGLPGCVNQQGWEDMAVEHAAADQGPTLGRAGVESEDEAELPLSGQGEKKEGAEERERQLDAMGEAWSLEISEPQEQRVPSEEGSPGALQDLEGQPEQVGALEVPVGEGIPEVTEPLLQDEDIAQTGEQDSIEVTLGSENATRAELVLEQEVVGLGGPTHLAREEANHPSLGEESVEAKIAQDLEGSGKEPTEAGALESESSELPRASSDTLESKGCRESEPVVGWAVEEASVETSDHEGSGSPQPRPSETEGDEGTQAALAPPDPKLVEPCSPTPILEDACEQQPQADGIQEAGWQLEGGSEALERVEDEQEFGLGEIPEGLQDWEESREESEADELGETLPDSTPLGLYLRSPTSPKWDLAGEQRLSPQGEARKEGWGPAVLSNPSGEEEQGHDSDLSSEEFEDLGTEVSLLPGLPKEVPPVPEPECWDQGGESDGFADEEESGEEGEEGTESGAQWWGPGSSGGGFKVQHITQRGDLLEHESVGVSGPWDDDLRGATANISVTGLETESQDSAEPSGSEGSESVSSEGEDQVPDHLGAPQGVTNMVPVGGDTFGISGQGPRLESEHMNGRMENGLEQSEGQGVLDGHQDQEYPSQEQEVGALKAPLVGSAVHQGPSQSLEFPLSGVDGDSWSSGED
ncbi:nestin [Cricetulus griseus]